jgi:hypothetical protein
MGESQHEPKGHQGKDQDFRGKFLLEVYDEARAKAIDECIEVVNRVLRGSHDLTRESHRRIRDCTEAMRKLKRRGAP